MKREKLWIIGALIMVFGCVLAASPILGDNGLVFIRDLSPCFGGFFIVGLAVINFGFLFALVSLHSSEKETAKSRMKNTDKLRTVLLVATIIYLILLGYFLWINFAQMPELGWEIRALVIGSFTIFNTLNLTTYTAFFITLISFGIFVLPFVINESGILGNNQNKPPEPDIIEG